MQAERWKASLRPFRMCLKAFLLKQRGASFLPDTRIGAGGREKNHRGTIFGHFQGQNFPLKGGSVPPLPHFGNVAEKEKKCLRGSSEGRSSPQTWAEMRLLGMTHVGWGRRERRN